MKAEGSRSQQQPGREVGADLLSPQEHWKSPVLESWGQEHLKSLQNLLAEQSHFPQVLPDP